MTNENLEVFGVLLSTTLKEIEKAAMYREGFWREDIHASIVKIRTAYTELVLNPEVNP
jgi:hypothetical protein